MGDIMRIKDIKPTVFLRNDGNRLMQLVRIELENQSLQRNVTILTQQNQKTQEFQLGTVMAGQTVHEVFIEDMTVPREVTFVLKVAGSVMDQKQIMCKPPRRWVVHVVQLSHHDVGYTDLASNVLKVHDRYLTEAIDIADATKNFPDEAKFRMVVEQTWSIDHFLKNATEVAKKKMIDLVREGRVEVTALFGNMTTEICGHEVLIRSLYHAYRLKRDFNIPIISAEHNDITGISWGLSQVLTDAGIKIFCPGLPLYYSWGGTDLQSFWDEEAIFGYKGPGAFWWEAPTGNRLLFWSNNSGCGGDVKANLPGLAERLEKLNDSEYPYSVLRWPVGGGARDNSPYIDGYAHTIKAWNEKWAYPRLICSTNAMFYQDFIGEVPGDLPVFRGELPGQDYPIAATSTAGPTAANRNNHIDLPAAEKLASAASMVTDYQYQDSDLFEAYEDTLWYDEHAWGHHFPCGPTARASEYEKGVHAYRAAAMGHDVANKAMARIADHINVEEGYYLVVFNTNSIMQSGIVRAVMREFDNCGSTMTWVYPEGDKESRYLRGVILGDRWHVNLPQEFMDGKFTMIDVETGESVPYQIVPVTAHDDTVPYAPQRFGIGTGGKRYGFFEVPIGLKRDLCFIAKNVPALGYRTYKLIPDTDRSIEPVSEKVQAPAEEGTISIENEYYRVMICSKSGNFYSLYDKEAQRELLDNNSFHPFNSLVVRTPNQEQEYVMESRKVTGVVGGSICKSIEVTGYVYGHPAVKQTITLYTGVKSLYFGTRILKDATPLLDVHIAFPFATRNPEFRYEGVLSVMDPIVDYLPASYSDTIAVQNWVKIKDGDYNILWSSLDAPIVGFGELAPGYVSPAHRCVIDESFQHLPRKVEDLNKGWIYSDIFYNNLGTNFAVCQTGDFLFRYVVTTCSGNVTDGEAAAFGWQAVQPFQTILTKGSQPNKQCNLPIKAGFLDIENPKVVLLNWKKSEDGCGYIMRLWNMEPETITTRVSFPFASIERIVRTNMAEEDLGQEIPSEDKGFSVTIGKAAIATLRIIFKEQSREML
jgi:hypothetical protein